MSSKSSYFIITISRDPSSDPHWAEIEKSANHSFECSGIQEFSMEEAEVDEVLGERAFGGGEIPQEVFSDVEKSVEGKKKYQFYFSGEKAKERSSGFVDHLVKQYPHLDFQVDQFEEEDWNEEWRKHYDVIDVTERIRIVPEWKREEYLKQESEYPKNIFIYPGQGFGTGEHETTFLCLKLFDQLNRELDHTSTLLDFGCGSGILGIAAIKLTKCGVDFMDIDEQALDNCQQNIDINFMGAYEESSLILRENFEVETPYPVVFANILENILIDEKNVITMSVEPGGDLIVSGLLNGQDENIIKQYADFDLIQTERKGDWCALWMKKCVQ